MYVLIQCVQVEAVWLKYQLVTSYFVIITLNFLRKFDQNHGL